MEASKEKFSNILEQVKLNAGISQSEKEVISKYGSLFSPENLPKLTEEDFKSFLLFKNNHHWSGIFRYGNILTEDMNKLHKALAILVDESQPIESRLNKLFPSSGNNYIRGLGKAVATPILMVVYPDKYGVWNSPSQQALGALGLLPKFRRGASFAEKYIKTNKVLLQLKEEYVTSLWKVDAALGEVVNTNFPLLNGQTEEAQENTSFEKTSDTQDQTEFGLESHLEDFIIENWEHTQLAKKYELLIEDGDIVSKQYSIDGWWIDILVKDKSSGDWLVIELKKGRASDKVIGQTLRYMGWVEDNKCNKGEKVTGLIIAKDSDKSLRYALKMVKDIEMMTYGVDFHLSSVNP